MNETPKNNRPIVLGTLEYGLKVLLCFRESQGAELSLTEVSKKIGRSVTNTYRLVYTLEQCGFLRRNPENKKFSLGAIVQILADYAVDNRSLIALAHPFLYKLREKYNENVNLYVYQNFKCLCIDRLESTHAVRETYPIGVERSLLKGSVGKSILAWLPFRVRSTVYATDAEDPPPDEELAAIRDQGFAFSSNETGKGTAGVASPIFDKNGKLLGAINISAPCYRFNDRVLSEWSRDVKEAAAAISRLSETTNQ